MLGTAISSLALAVTFGFAGALPVQATPHINEGVCLGLDSGKIDTVGNPSSVTVTAPEGMVITGYCVKAGSENQGDGPVYIDSLSLTTLVIAYPFTKGVPPKTVSHYSVSYGLGPIIKPPVTFIVHDFPLPTFIDKCGTLNDEVIPQKETDQARFYYDVDLRAVVAVAKEDDGYIIQQDIQFVWPNTNTDVPCEVVAPPVEEEPPAQVTVPPAKEAAKTPVSALVPASVVVNTPALKEWKRPTFNTNASSATSASAEPQYSLIGFATAALAILLLIGIVVVRRRRA